MLFSIGVGAGPAGPVLAGPLFLAVPAGPVLGRTTGPLEQHSNPTHGLHVLLAGPLSEAVLRHCSVFTYEFLFVLIRPLFLDYLFQLHRPHQDLATASYCRYSYFFHYGIISQ